MSRNQSENAQLQMHPQFLSDAIETSKALTKEKLYNFKQNLQIKHLIVLFFYLKFKMYLIILLLQK